METLSYQQMLTFHLNAVSMSKVENVIANFPPHLVPLAIFINKRHIHPEGRRKELSLSSQVWRSDTVRTLHLVTWDLATHTLHVVCLR